MLVVLLSGLVLLILGAVIPSKQQTYGSMLEKYIISNNPKNTYDVDRLTREFELRQHQGIV